MKDLEQAVEKGANYLDRLQKLQVGSRNVPMSTPDTVTQAMTTNADEYIRLLLPDLADARAAKTPRRSETARYLGLKILDPDFTRDVLAYAERYPSDWANFPRLALLRGDSRGDDAACELRRLLAKHCLSALIITESGDFLPLILPPYSLLPCPGTKVHGRRRLPPFTNRHDFFDHYPWLASHRAGKSYREIAKDAFPRTTRPDLVAANREKVKKAVRRLEHELAVVATLRGNLGPRPRRRAYPAQKR